MLRLRKVLLCNEPARYKINPEMAKTFALKPRTEIEG
jgi:hypothetical protein